MYKNMSSLPLPGLGIEIETLYVDDNTGDNTGDNVDINNKRQEIITDSFLRSIRNNPNDADNITTYHTQQNNIHNYTHNNTHNNTHLNPNADLGITTQHTTPPTPPTTQPNPTTHPTTTTTTKTHNQPGIANSAMTGALSAAGLLSSSSSTSSSGSSSSSSATPALLRASRSDTSPSCVVVDVRNGPNSVEVATMSRVEEHCDAYGAQTSRGGQGERKRRSRRSTGAGSSRGLRVAGVGATTTTTAGGLSANRKLRLRVDGQRQAIRALEGVIGGLRLRLRDVKCGRERPGRAGDAKGVRGEGEKDGNDEEYGRVVSPDGGRKSSRHRPTEEGEHGALSKR